MCIKKLLLVLILTSLACSLSPEKKEIKKVLLVSFDGFRYDYLTKANTPHFDKLVQSGVQSEGLIPIYPSVTFPNYYAIATGLYPENNGFISNSMYDSTIGAWFSMRDREQVENPDWYYGEPIWNTVEKNGLVAGTMFWVGSEAPIQDMRPTFWKRYDGDMPNEARIDSVLKWMTLGTEQEIDFGTLYFSFVDEVGHDFGPNSPEIEEAVQKADDLMGYFIGQLKDKNIFEHTNLIIAADHGMAQLSRDKVIYVDNYINTTDLDIYSWGTSFSVRGNKEVVEEVYQQLKPNEKNFRVYKKENLPERFHLKKSHRVPDLIAIPNTGYLISTKGYVESRSNYATGGTHGFDNQAKEMHGIFIAYGPDFKKGFKMEAFENIHIYELIANLLNIESAGTDGSIDNVSAMIK